MQKLVKPNDDPESVFLMCISRVRDDDLKTRLTSMSSAIKDYANLSPSFLSMYSPFESLEKIELSFAGKY